MTAAGLEQVCRAEQPAVRQTWHSPCWPAAQACHQTGLQAEPAARGESVKPGSAARAGAVVGGDLKRGHPPFTLAEQSRAIKAHSAT